MDAERFCDFYASKGWMIGNQRMKDWRAAVRTWEKRGDTQAAQRAAPAQQTSINPFAALAAKYREQEGRT